jgi:hypothetical protein
MATAYDGSIRINTNINDRSFNTSVRGMVNNTNSLNRGVGNVNTSMNGLVGVAKKLGGVLAAVFVVKQLVEFGKKAVTLASDLQEVQNVVSVAFGDMTFKMEEFAKTSIETFGLSELTAKKTASSYAAMAKGMQFSTEASADMALQLTGLSADMASFFNITQDEARTALSAIFTGETETLKRYGILITEVNLQEFARQQGITKSITKMTQQEKVMLRLNYVMKATSQLQGDFQRTSGSFANQTRILSERWKELLGIIGKGLITVLTPVLKFLNNLVQTLIDVSSSVGDILSKTFGIDVQTTASTGTTSIDTSGYDDAASAIEDTTAAQEGLTDATDKTAKAAKNAVAPFDDIAVLQQDTTDSSGNALADTEATTAATNDGIAANSKLANAISNVADKVAELKNTMQEFFKPFVDSWNEYGGGVIESIKTAFSSIWELIKAIGKSFMEVWTNGTGELALGLILSIITNIFKIVGNLAKSFTTAWQNAGIGTQIIQNIADIINILLGYIDRITKSMATWVSTIDWTPLLQGVASVTEALKPFAGQIGEGLLWFFNEVLAPLGSFVIEDIVPLFLEGLANAIDIVVAVIEALKPLALWLWESFLKPLAEWTGGVIVDILKVLVGLLGDIATWCTNNKPVVEGITIAILAFFAAWKVVELLSFIQQAGGVVAALAKITTAIWACTGAKIADKLETVALTLMYAKDFVVSVAAGTVALVKQAAQWVINTALKIAETVATMALTVATVAWNSVCVIATAVTTALGVAIAFLTSPIGLVILAVAAIIAVIVLLVKNWDTVKEVAAKTWDAIVDAWKSAGEWFNSKVIKPIAKFFSELWELLKETAKEAWEGITEAFSKAGEWFMEKVIDPITKAFESLWGGIKKIINGILSMIEGFINAIIAGINLLINALNTINLDIPSWVPLLGGKSFGIDLPNVSKANIPRLAEGAVIQPNQEFLAVLGDQRNGVNIEAPLSTIVDGVKTALSGMDFSNNRGPTTLIFEMEGKAFARAILPFTNSESSRMGVKLVTGGI